MRGPAARARQKAIVEEKLSRLALGEPLRVLDLFSGCGGISLGFQRAGCRIDAAVEIDALAAATHALNFHRYESAELAVAHAVSRDITQIEPEQLTEGLGLGPAANAFDIVVGGPPCQAYTRIGRAKLREIAEDPKAFKTDPRANLYVRYLDYVNATLPLAILVENVPDALNFGGHNVIEEMAEALSAAGYTARYTLINAAFYGVPQMRDRAFLLALREELGVEVKFPKPTRYVKLPSGYRGSRAVALKNIAEANSGFFVEPEQPSSQLRSAVTCRQAIGDLPPITAHLKGELKRGARRFDKLTPYKRSGRNLSSYARAMRNWPGFAGNIGVWDHVIRCLPRDAQTFREMPNGAEYPKAHATATAIWERKVKAAESKKRRKLSAEELENLKRAIVPPYPLGSFPNRWWKLVPEFPSRTLMAHMGKDTYSHIHYDAKQARVISVREAARLQSFPDGFRFCGTMNPAFRQIGNAVPPLLSHRLAQTICQSIAAALTKRNSATSKNAPALEAAE
jgi:DNA (cytosine-5)-methyltransferase 1